MDIKVDKPYVGYWGEEKAAERSPEKRCWIFISNALEGNGIDEVNKFVEENEAAEGECTLSFQFNISDILDYLEESHALFAKHGSYDIDGKKEFDNLRADLAGAIARIDSLKFE